MTRPLLREIAGLVRAAAADPTRAGTCEVVPASTGRPLHLAVGCTWSADEHLALALRHAARRLGHAGLSCEGEPVAVRVRGLAGWALVVRRPPGVPGRDARRLAGAVLRECGWDAV